MTALDDLLDTIFDGRPSALSAEFADWVRGSRRFREFAITYRAKIRAKRRNARDEAGLQDLRAELEAAVSLLRDPRFTLEYEKYAAAKQRGPDFTVTFKTHTPFNVEVRRIRNVEWADLDAEASINKLIAVIIDKVGQMPPSIVNLLWLVAEREIEPDDLARAAITVRRLAERKTEEIFPLRGFESAADFLKQYRQLSGIVLHRSSENLLWLNPIARHKVPPEIATAILRLEPI